MDPNDIANAFNQQNDKRNWKARALGTTRKDNPAQLVNFSSTAGMVALEYDCETGKFAVKFNKFTGAWGDYIKAIARSLHVVLNTLKSAGLPFEAPPTLTGMVIEAVTTDDNTVHVRWQGAAPVFNADLVDMGELPAPCPITEATMPELRAKFTPPTQFAVPGYSLDAFAPEAPAPYMFNTPAGHEDAADPLAELANAATFPGGDFAWMDAAKYEAPTFEGDAQDARFNCPICDQLGYACAQHDPNQARLPDIL